MGHHSAAYTLDVYGHLIDAELAPALDLRSELASRPSMTTPWRAPSGRFGEGRCTPHSRRAPTGRA